ncbi:beta-galactosidase [Streptomyces orinoci]|uniref:Beta-galactosidase n=1 Tax=Streptomyces orinoci TaxID=67339 RepID=A0ABV3JS11_STRON|nr:beta-galactosidase [Streptomyces orinoci]
MSTDLATALLPGLNRPAVIGEYPYYRAEPGRWAVNLRELRALGVDIVSCYLPWRFHETAPGAFDFTGATDPQRNITGLLDAAAEAGLAVLLKPGPFIHAEVQLGGLPDRLCEPGRAPYTALAGTTLTSQAKPLPSLFAPEIRQETAGWLRAVTDQVIGPRLAPAGPVVAVQLGNEGICGDAHLPITGQDGGPHARAAFAAWLTGQGLDAEARQAEHDLDRWSGDLRLLWSRWSGQAIADVWHWLAGLLPESVTKVVNVPLAPVAGDRPTVDAWAARSATIARCGYRVGHTEWVGNPSADPEAFRAHLLGIRLGRSDVLEANWGFTWTDKGFAEPRTPVFNALLALALGSSTVSVYTACATRSWGADIDMDADGLRAEGVDPALHEPPYCPGAPVTEDGAPGATAEGLRLLGAFLDRFGPDLLTSELHRDAVLGIDRALPEADAWVPEQDSALRQTAAAVQDLLARRGLLVDVRWLDGRPVTGALRAGPEGEGLVLRPGAVPPGAVAEYLASLLPEGAAEWANEGGRACVIRRTGPDAEFIAVFNPTDAADRVAGRVGGRACEITVPGGTAAVAVVTGSTLAGWVATPAAPGGLSVELTVDGRPVDDLRVLPALG